MNVVDFPDQRRQPADPQPAGEHPHHLRIGGLARRICRRSSACSRWRGCPEPYHPVFEAESFRRASIDGFFVSIEVPEGTNPADVAADVRGVGSIEVQIVEESER